MAGRYRLGKKLAATPGNMWDLIRSDVASEPGLGHDRLLMKMMSRSLDDLPERVRRDRSQQGIGSERWCAGYINGAVREGCIERF